MTVKVDRSEFDALYRIYLGASDLLSFVREKHSMISSTEFDCPYMKALDEDVKNFILTVKKTWNTEDKNE